MSKKVALMCGHGKSTDGSWDCGTSYGGNNEAALMLPITKAAVKYLRSWGVSVISDADNNNNKNMIADCAWSDKWGADVYVSVHCDYYKAPSGVMPLYVSTKGKQLATCLNNAVKSGMGMKSRGVVKRTDLYELNYPDAISCILETGSIKADISILKNKADAYGKCIAKGICDYLGVKITATTASTAAPATTTTTVYRVRKSWTDAKSQVGAYKVLANAKKVADEKGLNVYDSKGKLVYAGKKKEPTKADKLVAKAKELAWAKGTASSKYKYPSGSATSAFKTALNKVYPEHTKWGKAPSVGASCDVFVGTCVRSAGLDSKFERGLEEQLTYKSSAFDRYEYKNIKPIDKAEYGDIVMFLYSGGGHTVILGDGCYYEANYQTYFGHTNSSLDRLKKSYKKVVILRPKK